MKFLGQHHDFEATLNSIGGEYKDKVLDKVRRMGGQIVGVHAEDNSSATLIFLTSGGGRFSDRTVVNRISTNDPCISHGQLGYRYPDTEGLNDQLVELVLKSNTPAFALG